MITEPMTLQPVNSASSRNRWWRLSRAKRSLLAIVIALALIPLNFLDVFETRARIDPVTGSIQQQTVLPFGISGGHRVDVSQLEIRLKNSGAPWTRNWQFLHSAGHTLFGRVTWRACNSAPPIYELRAFAPQFLATSNDNDIRAFVRIMQFGTEAEQRAAVQAAGEKALWSSPPN